MDNINQILHRDTYCTYSLDFGQMSMLSKIFYGCYLLHLLNLIFKNYFVNWSSEVNKSEVNILAGNWYLKRCPCKISICIWNSLQIKFAKEITITLLSSILNLHSNELLQKYKSAAKMCSCITNNVYLLVCHVPFIANGAVRILHRAINHMTDQQIYFSDWRHFVHICLGLICDIWTNYL